MRMPRFWPPIGAMARAKAGPCLSRPRLCFWAWVPLVFSHASGEEGNKRLSQKPVGRETARKRTVFSGAVLAANNAPIGGTQVRDVGSVHPSQIGGAAIAFAQRPLARLCGEPYGVFSRRTVRQNTRRG